MANSAQAKKRARQNIKRREQNVAKRSKMRTFIKKLRKALVSNDKTAVGDLQKAAFPVIDKMVSKDLIHKNTAARYKSRLNKQVKNLTTD